MDEFNSKFKFFITNANRQNKRKNKTTYGLMVSPEEVLLVEKTVTQKTEMKYIPSKDQVFFDGELKDTAQFLPELRTKIAHIKVDLKNNNAYMLKISGEG